MKGTTGDERGQDGGMESPTWRTSLSELWEMMRTGKPGVLHSMGSQRVGHD